jgi:hypothetical protein
MPLAQDISGACFALRIETVELLLKAILGRLARIAQRVVRGPSGARP